MKFQFRERNPLIVGIVGTAAIIAVTLIALNLEAMPFVDRGSGYHAVFTETAGLKRGDPVQVAGVQAGRVSGMRIDGATVVVDFTVDHTIPLGEDTRADIGTATVLGTKLLRVTPSGPGTLRRGATIPLSRTSSPYQLTDALGDLTDTERDIDTGTLADSMNALSATLQHTPDDLRGALDGVTRLSKTVSTRDRSLRELLQHAERATSVLAVRSNQISAMIGDADAVLGQLQQRSAVIDTLFEHVATLADQLTGVVHDNQAQLTPALDQVNSVLSVLQKDKDDIGAAIERLGPYVTELGEAVASGPFFNSYIQNLIPGQIIDPFVQQALHAAGIPGQPR
ncbi:MCE family protein [Speluncibacter jeojiensis]|uniref:MCE family protein n=1 Tax=Speluncibacter jeojiensis TaxID=2710754 RepID=A0A9X4RDY7_9ACTN|nr:MCE family protein [Corynebacteriales bacterium D3-21]